MFRGLQILRSVNKLLCWTFFSFNSENLLSLKEINLHARHGCLLKHRLAAPHYNSPHQNTLKTRPIETKIIKIKYFIISEC